MSRIVLIFFSCSILLGLFFSCEKDRALDEKIEFFSKQERDPLIIGSWKNNSSEGRVVEVIDFLPNGRYRSNMGTPYTHYYTKGQMLYLLRTGNHSNNPIVVVMYYKLNGDSLILDSEELGIKQSLIKL